MLWYRVHYFGVVKVTNVSHMVSGEKSYASKIEHVVYLQESFFFFLFFRYEKITIKWPNTSIIASATDSYIFNLTTPNIREDLADKIFNNFLDFSTFNHEDPMYNTSRESKVGYWKIETGSDRILSSTGIRPKVYSLQYVPTKVLKDITKRLKIINI